MASNYDDYGAYLPSQEEIRCECKKIQATWTEAMRQRRAMQPARVEYSLPAFAMDRRKGTKGCHLININTAKPLP